ncbi:hypothetical protein B0H67DRAFT_99330 [Lasiosphaeris hirsuta]|uniref:Uncharacterized protein n=1 Tax=Lasiosphaeris hirsuta TaxID=260670 RepID=A0AA40AXZ9_9PEZI|nr:hypothetical protein B0H67DRAFT_99330 [Lasiosphaeris hirsuta]
MPRAGDAAQNVEGWLRVMREALAMQEPIVSLLSQAPRFFRRPPSFLSPEKEKRRGSQQEPGQFGIFISGAPPLKFEGDNRIVVQLADESSTVIHIPTFHIFGCDDAFLSSSVALFDVCDLVDTACATSCRATSRMSGCSASFWVRSSPVSRRPTASAPAPPPRPEMVRTGSETDEGGEVGRGISKKVDFTTALLSTVY